MSVRKTIVAALHGESPAPGTLVATYFTGAAGAALALLSRGEELRTAGFLPNLVLALVALDMFAGAVANQGEGTRRFYRERPVALRYAFLAVHALQPALLALLVEPEAWPYLAASYLWALAGGSIVLGLRRKATREAAAGAFFALGTACCLGLFEPAGGLAWFAPVYLAKLILGFALGAAGGRDA